MMRACQGSVLRALLALLLVVPGAAFAAQDAPASATSTASNAKPEQIVQHIATELGNKIDGHRAELKNNRDKLLDVIDSVFRPYFDVDYAAILVLGRHARSATPEQRHQFAQAFYDSITHRYAEGLLNYTKGVVTVLPFRGELDPRRSVVRTQVNLDNGKTVSVNYAFRKTRDGQWKAYDVIIEGISYITNYRSQVDAQIRQEGLDALIKQLQSGDTQALENPAKASSD